MRTCAVAGNAVPVVTRKARTAGASLFMSPPFVWREPSLSPDARVRQTRAEFASAPRNWEKNMDLEYSADERAFRDEVRAFVQRSLPADLAAKVHEGKRLSRDDFLRWHKILHKQGWVAAGWPKEFGGPGWTPVQQHIFDEECAAAGAPFVIPFGVRMVAPVIQRFGNGAQKEYFLPRILSGEHWW